MNTTPDALLCELHAHTRWSDGALPLRALIDLHGALGYDVLCVTDNVVRLDDPWVLPELRGPRYVHAGNFDAYFDEVETEAVRAHALYGLLVIPGLELTDNHDDPLRSAHALAIGVRDFIAVDDGLDRALPHADAQGAAIVAAHPAAPGEVNGRAGTLRFGSDPTLASLVHRYELFNRNRIFPWVAEESLPAVASGDVHVVADLAGWRTLSPCAKERHAVVEYLRTSLPVFLTRLEPTLMGDELAA